jgi:undecaprenyl-diphosphatase
MTAMWEYLSQLDTNWFHAVNRGCAHTWLDAWVPWLRNKYLWLPVYVFVGSFLLVNGRRAGMYLLVGWLATVGLTDLSSSRFLKRMVARERPCQVMEPDGDIRLLVSCGSGHSFPSSHAANHFAMAVFLAGCFGRRWGWVRILLPAWAAAVAFAQVYVGVHYPLDAVAGALLGSGLGWLGIKGTNQLLSGG